MTYTIFAFLSCVLHDPLPTLSVRWSVSLSVNWLIPFFAFSVLWSFMSPLLLPKCPSDLFFRCVCPPTLDWGSSCLIGVSFLFCLSILNTSSKKNAVGTIGQKVGEDLEYLFHLDFVFITSILLLSSDIIAPIQLLSFSLTAPTRLLSFILTALTSLNCRLSSPLHPAPIRFLMLVLTTST